MSTVDSRGRSHAPAVQAQATRLGVDLGTIDGTGTGGRVTIANVLTAAPRPAPTPPSPSASARAQQETDYLALFGEPLKPAARLPRESTAYRRQPITGRSAFSPMNVVEAVEVTVDRAGVNPLLEDAAQWHPCYPLAMEEAVPPTCFAQGDLPSFTASGVDPKVLLDLPWNVRHYAASAESKATVLAMVEQFADDPTMPAIPGVDDGYYHPGAEKYARRMEAWLIGPPADPFPDSA